MQRGGPYPAGPWRYLWWLIRGQGWRVLLGALLGSTWMVGLAVPPLLLSLAVDDGLRRNHALVAAQRTVDFLAIGPDQHPGDQRADVAATVSDPASGLQVNHGEFAVVAASDRREAKAILERLAGLEPSDARLGDTLLSDIDSETLRASVLPLEDNDFLFAGRLHEVIFTDGNDTASARERIAVASGIDEIVRGLDEGWDTVVRLRGANFSGGQRQRLRLARAMAANPPVLLGLDPLSAVDAITETHVVHRVRDSRRGMTTVFFSDSATVLDAADVVHFVEDGRVVASGRDRSLTASHPAYRVLVARDTLREPRRRADG
ncbi:ABC transporter ATP-binding protein [Planctomonas sp. JC2975]|uniref:ATP-binding cassette domain-containing protein n=1 Tax=Planctomonas sp. JC2975 TaxID=2729626 RepID=UPI00147668B1|nr:ABC transporter ATP-binding protein [Planctomonas sp. JC2975]NNC12366.1 ABC transporter ATP-binding protein [Planctomonas sp. JC2975]